MLSARTWAFLVAVALIACLAACTAPLATYVITLALFGLVHVLSELRYVDRRFTARLPFAWTLTWLGLIALIVLLRMYGMALGPVPHAAAIELLLVAALALGGLLALRRANWPRRLLGAFVLVSLLFGAWTAPVVTLVVLAVLHNLTPIGFLLERLQGRARWVWGGGALILFLVVPALIALGWTRDVLDIGLSAGAPLGSGSLTQHLGVFVPATWHGRADVASLFAAAAYLQSMHYAVVIGVLPSLEPESARAGETWIRWPARRVWFPALCLVGCLSLALFAWSFRDARAFYGLFALVHAWIEVPLLLAALAPLPEAA